MNVDEVITLQNGCNYGLLLKSNLDGGIYFLAVQLNNNDEPTDNYKVLKEIKDNDELFVVEEKDPLILYKLLEDYRVQSENEN